MQKATSMTIPCRFNRLWCPESGTYDTIFVIASYGLYYRCSDFERQSVFVDKIARMIYFQDDDDGENCNDIMAF